MAVDFGSYFVSLDGWVCGMFGAIVDRRPNDCESQKCFSCATCDQCFHTFPYVCRLQYDFLSTVVSL